MTALARVADPPQPALPFAELDPARGFIAAEKAAATRRAYL
jgi:hypothetical protein